MANMPTSQAPANATIELLRGSSLAMLAQQEMERRIIGGEIAAGGKLNEADIATELGISRGPVREAFRALEQSGLVRTEKNRGVFVRSLSLQQACEIYEVRAALDALIGQLAAKRITQDQLARLRLVVKRMGAGHQADRPDSYFPLNLEFHQILAQASANSALIANYQRVVNELTLFRRETLVRSAENIRISTRDHEGILQAVSNGNADLASRLLFDHVMQSRERLIKAFEPSHSDHEST